MGGLTTCIQEKVEFSPLLTRPRHPFVHPLELLLLSFIFHEISKKLTTKVESGRMNLIMVDENNVHTDERGGQKESYVP